MLCELLMKIADNITYYGISFSRRENLKYRKTIYFSVLIEKNNELPSVVQTAYHEALDKIEQLVQRNEAATDLNTIYSVIEYVCDRRSERSIVQLMEFKATKISETQPQWLQELNSFMHKFYNMRNKNIRNQSLQVLSRVMDLNR